MTKVPEIFFLKKGNTRPYLRFRLLPADVDLTGATVRFRARRPDGTNVLDAPAFIIRAKGEPTVEYRFQPGDFDEVGNYQCDFLVSFAGGVDNATYPNRTFISLIVSVDALG